MKKGIRKMLSAIACAALAMGCLAGCGSNTNSSAANTTTESAAENTSTAAAETASDKLHKYVHMHPSYHSRHLKEHNRYDVS